MKKLTQIFSVQNAIPLVMGSCVLAFAPCAYQGASAFMRSTREHDSADETEFAASRPPEKMVNLQPQRFAQLAAVRRGCSRERGVYRCILSESETPLPAGIFGFHPRALYDGAPGDTRTGFSGRMWQREGINVMCLIDLGDAPPRCAAVEVRFASSGLDQNHQLYGSRDGVNWRSIVSLVDGTMSLPRGGPALRYFQVVIGIKATQRASFKGINVTDVRLYDESRAVIGGQRRWKSPLIVAPDDTYDFDGTLPFS